MEENVSFLMRIPMVVNVQFLTQDQFVSFKTLVLVLLVLMVELNFFNL